MFMLQEFTCRKYHIKGKLECERKIPEQFPNLRNWKPYLASHKLTFPIFLY